ncbi:MAG: hypothetical protein ACI4MI_05580 [Christensenellales bacterium]
MDEQDKQKTMSARTYKCASCGNFLHYDPQSKKLKCDHCDSEYELEKVGAALEIAYNDETEKGFEDWGEVKCVKCKSCGAVTVLNKYDMTGNCSFCGANNVVSADELPGLKPTGILPFSITKDTAIGNFKKWIKKRFFAPGKFKKDNKKEDVNGLYVPIFTFDCDASTPYTIRYGEHYYVTVGSGKNRRTVQKTRWYVDSGFVKQRYDDIQVEASNHIEQKDLTKMGGFDSQNACGYHSQFLAGYAGERYSTGLDECWGKAVKVIDSSLEAIIKAKYHYDVLDYVKINPSYDNKKYKYIFAPIWLVSYHYDKKQYNDYVNGRSGVVTGEYPKSKPKIAGVCVAIGVIVAALIYLGYKFFVG